MTCFSKNAKSRVQANSWQSLFAAGKPVALCEVGLAPGDAVLGSQAHAYFLMWGQYEQTGNTAADLRALYNGNSTVNRGDF